MRIILVVCFLAACNMGRYTVQEKHTQTGVGASVDTLTALGFEVDSATANRVVTTWERYTVRPANEIQLRIVVVDGTAKGQCTERKIGAWYFRPCNNKAALERIAQALGEL